MDFDFNLILVPATLVFFFIWLLDKMVFKHRKTKGKGSEHFVIGWAYDFWPILAVVVVVRSFFFEPYNIPSSSMVPTLETGDFILVNKSAFGVRLPLVHSKILNTGAPARGDVAVFRFPPKPSIYFIKRVVGLPKDVVRFERDQLYINGEPAPRQRLQFVRDAAHITQLDAKERASLPYYQEQAIEQKRAIEDKVSYHEETLGKHTFLTRGIDDAYPNSQFLQKNSLEAVQTQGQAWEVVVPEGHYFVMGDNRDFSEDSRFWGFVPEKNLSGKAVYVWMHKAPGLNMPSFSQARKIQ